MVSKRAELRASLPKRSNSAAAPQDLTLSSEFTQVQHAHRIATNKLKSVGQKLNVQVRQREKELEKLMKTEELMIRSM
jgi:phosphopantothenoylcysteine synthetase/decarboxylase